MKLGRLSISLARVLLLSVFAAGVFLLFRQAIASQYAALSATALLAFLAACLISVIATLRRGGPRRRRWRWPFGIFVLGVLLSVPFVFTGLAFGDRSLYAILVALRENQFGDLLGVGIDAFVGLALWLALGIAAVLFLGHLVHRHLRFGGLVVAVGGLALTVSGSLSEFLLQSYWPNPDHGIVAAELDRLAPRIAARPERPPNLVLVYLESLERSYGRIDETRAAFAPLAALEARGLALTDIDEVHGTGMTIAGMIASQCGVPMVSRGVYSPHVRRPGAADRFRDGASFYPGLTCLGDVLNADGYRLSYLNGSTLDVFSKREFLTAHGFDRARGFRDFDGWETEPRRNVWGMSDDLLFERVSAELEALASDGRPFVLATLTLATHGPDGFPDPSCETEGFALALDTAIHCTGRHVEALLDRIEALGLSDRTVGAVRSDHLAYRNSRTADLRALGGARRNYVTLLNTGRDGEIARAGTMFDLYPTLLEAMGYALEDGRAGLGVSLLSEAPTLRERHGAATLSSALRGNRALAETLWPATRD